MRSFIRIRHVLTGDLAAVKVLKNALCFGVFSWHGNTFFCMPPNIGPINVCTYFVINRYKIDKFRKHGKICFIWRHVTSWGLETFWNQPEVSTAPGSKVMAQTVVSCFGDLDLDLWHSSHALCMNSWNLHTVTCIYPGFALGRIHQFYFYLTSLWSKVECQWGVFSDPFHWCHYYVKNCLSLFSCSTIRLTRVSR